MNKIKAELKKISAFILNIFMNGVGAMKTLKKFIFFIVTYNVLFILILNLQYMYRFNREFDLSMLMYSSIASINFCIIPLVCFSVSWIISKYLIQKLQISSLLNPVIILLITVIPTYMFIELKVNDSIWSLIMVSSTILTLFLFFYIYRKDVHFTH